MRSGDYEYSYQDNSDTSLAEPGYYRTRITKGGAFIPIEVVEICQRDASGHIETDVEYRAYAWPLMQSDERYEWEHDKLNPFYLKTITKDEFKWMILLKSL